MNQAWRRPIAALGLGAVLACATPALAAAPLIGFDIPREDLAAALADLAIQAKVSISTGKAAACQAPKDRLVGRFTLEQGLRRLLAGTGCGYRLVDAQAVEIVRLAPEPQAAQPPGPIVAPADISELVVVATRRPTPSARLAYPVSLVEGERLAEQGVDGARGLAALTPSMMVTNLGSGRDKILLRGLSDGPLTGRTQSMVGIYLDDVRITYNAPDPDLRLVDMGQVEVLRGPQGALYGAGSLGGVLHLATRPPDPLRRAAWLSVGGAATQGGAPSGTIEGMINLPVLDGQGAVRLVAYREALGGYVDDPQLGLKNVNRSVREGGRLSAILDLGPRWRLKGGVSTQFISSDDTQYAIAGLAPYERHNRVREPHDNDFLEAHLGLHGDLDWGAVNWSSALIRHQLVSRYDASAAPPTPMPPGPAAFDDSDDINSLVTEATLASPAGASVEWLAGGFLAFTRQVVDLRLSSIGAPALSAFEEARRDRLRESAVFGQATLPLTDRLRLTLGGRYFATEARVSSTVRTPLDGRQALFNGRLSHVGFAPKIELAFQRAPGQLFYLEAAEGYRVGGANTTGAPDQLFGAAGGSEPYRFYQGDELWSFELGARFSDPQDRFSLRAAVFDVVWSNIQSDQLLSSGLPFTANIGDGRNLGVEMEAGYRRGPLRLQAALLANGPELDRANPAFPARPELGLAGAPKVSFSTSAHYAWPLGGSWRAELDGRYAYVGPSRLTFDAQTSPRMGDYSTARVAATLASPRWRVTAAVDNPAEVRGDTFAYGNPFTLRTARQVTPQRPRTVSLTVRADF